MVVIVLVNVITIFLYGCGSSKDLMGVMAVITVTNVMVVVVA